MLTRLAASFVPRLAAVLLMASVSSTLACSKVTMVTAEGPIAISAHPPAPPLPDLPSVPQPPPPPRVTLDGDLLALDEALTFDEAGKLSSEHQDILAELAKWLAAHGEVLVLGVEVQSADEGSRRKQDKRNKALATQIVDALVAEGIDAERLLAVSAGKSEDGQVHVVLRIIERAEPAAVEVSVEK
jgi:hypothetical protein